MITLPTNFKIASPLPIDSRYWVDDYTQINSTAKGPLYEGMHRWTRDTKKEFIYEGNGVWKPANVGLSGTISIGTVTTGVSPSITNVGTAENAILNIVLPQGDAGEDGATPTITVVGVETLAAGEDAEVENIGTDTDIQLILRLPQGEAGVGIPIGGSTGQVLKKLSNTNYAVSWQDDISGHTIEDETTPLTQRSKLSFQGAQVSVTDDSVNNRTIVTITGVSSEDVQDIAGAMVANSASIEFTYDDTSGTLTAIVPSGAITQAMLSAALQTKISGYDSHLTNTSNPHSVTKSQVGLGSADNTSDSAKPVSTATQLALNSKLNKEGITTGGSADAYTLTSPSNPITSYAANESWIVRFHTPNLTTTPNINIDGVGAVDIVKSDGTAVTAGDCKGIMIISYRADLSKVQLVGGSGSGGHIIEEETTPITNRGKLSFQGASVVVTDDSANDRTVVTISGLTTEDVQDIVGAMSIDSSTIDFTYDDGAGTLTAILKDASVTIAKILGTAIVPLTANTSASLDCTSKLIANFSHSTNTALTETLTNVTDGLRGRVIFTLNTASSVLITLGSVGGFTHRAEGTTTGTLASFTLGAGTSGRIQTVDFRVEGTVIFWDILPALSVYGNAINGNAAAQAILFSADDRLLGRVSGAIIATQITLGMIPDLLITGAKLAANTVTFDKVQTIPNASIPTNISGATGTMGTATLENFYNFAQDQLSNEATGQPEVMVACVATSIADKTVGATVAETTLLAASMTTVEKTIPATRFQPKKGIRLSLGGYLTTDVVPPTARVRIKIGSVTVVDTTAASLVAVSSAGEWEIKCELICRTIGATGTFHGQGHFGYNSGVSTFNRIQAVNTAVSTVNTTIDNLIDVTFEWGTSHASNTITCTNTIIEYVN